MGTRQAAVLVVWPCRGDFCGVGGRDGRAALLEWKVACQAKALGCVVGSGHRRGRGLTGVVVAVD